MTKAATIVRYGKRIRDAEKDITIHVKPVDIKGAVCKDHAKCVVAKAIMRQKKSTTKWVDVGNHTVLIGPSKSTGIRYILPQHSAAQIRFFDENDGRFAPCAVELRAPKPSREIGARVDTDPGKTHPKRKSPRAHTR